VPGSRRSPRRRECPHCGAAVPRGAAACPECGSDEETGWVDDETLDHAAADIPDAYDPDLWEEDGRKRERREHFHLVVAIAIVLGLLGLFAILIHR
jgi:hypothetical protein